MEKGLWTAGRGDHRGKKAMESREWRLQRVEKRLWTEGIGDYRELKKGYGQQV